MQPFTAFVKVLVSSDLGPRLDGRADELRELVQLLPHPHPDDEVGRGRAFVGIGSSYRVGFMTIYTTPSSSGSDPGYLPINDYTTTQKTNFFTKLYAQSPGGGTPLKQALSEAALNMAGKVGPDPQQYSCQQNFILMSTDGYWNSGTANGKQLNGSTDIGNQDNNITTAPRPQYDGGLSGSSNTLADVAYYYYNTDLRPSTGTCNTGVSGADVCANNVPISGIDNAPWQHITLFTLGLGTNGQLVYDKNYLGGGSADFNAIVSSSADWPTPVGDTLTTIDDLWHAAVNGHGQYFSAKNPDLLVSGLNTAPLRGVRARSGVGAAAATSNLEPVAGDNFAFVASYTTQEWTGDLQSRTIDLTSGSLSTAANWSAQALLDATTTDVSDTRNIFTFLNGVKTDFVPGNVQRSAEDGLVHAERLARALAIRGMDVGAADGRDARHGHQLPARPVRIRGARHQRRREPALPRPLPRAGRHHRRQAGVHARAAVPVRGEQLCGLRNVGREPFRHGLRGRQRRDAACVRLDHGPGAVGLHPLVRPAEPEEPGERQLREQPHVLRGRLADHQRRVDRHGNWRTILVGGLGGGGKGYFALDVTTPASPTILWEYSNANLGFTYGNPLIGKLTDGTWTVMFTSGYNNIGDGVGRVYVLERRNRRAPVHR